MDPLRISLFGGIRLERSDSPPVPIPSAAGRSLLAYLVTNRDRAHTRGLLAGKLWPEIPEQVARRRLSQALWQIQTVLAELTSGESYILAESNTVRFNTAAPYWLDVQEFESALDESNSAAVTGSPREFDLLRRAVDLYSGDYLEGFYDKWDDYQIDERRYRELYLDSLGRLVQLCKSRGAYDDARNYALRIVGQDPLQEDAHRELMRLYLLKGQTTEAIRAYEDCRAILAQELSATPDAETEALYERILEVRRKGVTPITALPDAPLSSSAAVPFVGRESERAALFGRLDDVLAGRGGMVLVEGDAGVGKTRILAELEEAAAWRTMELLWGGCIERAPLRPFGPIREALEGGLSQEVRVNQLAGLVDGVWLREVSRIVPALGTLPNLPAASPLKADEESDRMREAIAQTVYGLGKVMPHVFVLEDMQWADDDTLLALDRLARELVNSNVLVIVSFRGDEMRQRPEAWLSLRGIDRHPGVSRLRLDPLDQTESGELVRRAMGRMTVDSELADRIYYHMGGNPAFTLESLRLMLDEQAGDALTELGAIPIPESVHGVVERRLAWLGEEVMPVARALAVHGRATDRQAVEVMCPGEPIDRALDLLQRHGHIVADQGGYRFAQRAHRQVVYDGIDRRTRRTLHRLAGELIEAGAPEEIEELALHFAEGGVAARALPYLHRAAIRSSSAYAYRTSASYFERAIGLIEESGGSFQDHGGLLMEAERVFDVLGRRAEQETILDLLSQFGSDPEVELRRVWLLAHTDRFEDSVAAAERALAAGPDSGGAVRIALGMALNWSGRPGEGMWHLEAAADVEAADPLQAASARAALGNVLSEVQEYGAARVQLEEALSWYQDLGDSRGEAETLGLLGTIAMEQGNVPAAEDYARRSLEVSRSIGYLHGTAVSLGNLGNCLLFRGLISEAVAAYDESIAVFRSIGNRRGEALVGINAATVHLSILGDSEGAAEMASRGFEYFDEIGHLQGQANCLSILGSVARLQGRSGEARNLLESGLENVSKSGHRWSEVLARRTLALLELDEGNFVAARRHLTLAEATAAELGFGDVLIGLKALQGMALLGEGNAEEAFAATGTAVESLHDGVEQPYLIEYWHALSAQASSEPVESGAALERAYRGLMSCLDGFDPDQREQAISSVPEHRDILRRWEELRASRVTALVPRADAPIGRPLREDEWVEVYWTIDAPTDSSIARPADLRKVQIRRLVAEAAEQGAVPTVDQLADALRYSVATVKRDLKALRDEGYEITTRGAKRPGQ